MRHALQTSRSGGRLFAKWGLRVRAGARFRLIVPRRLGNDVSIGWGNAGEGHVGRIIAVNRCRAGHARWVDFAGGYWVKKPICVPLIVAKGDQRRRVKIGIGKACPGQLPPPWFQATAAGASSLFVAWSRNAPNAGWAGDPRAQVEQIC
jgi:hypothetical protein